MPQGVRVRPPPWVPFRLEVIALFDSGMGGLSILAAILKRVPSCPFAYFADTAYMPYGSQTRACLRERAHGLSEWLIQRHQPDCLVMACHTTACLFKHELESRFQVPILSPLDAMCEQIQDAVIPGKIVILCTPASAQSRSHEVLLRLKGVQSPLYTCACPDFVPLIEAPSLDLKALKRAAFNALQAIPPLVPGDALIYACTHYPFVMPHFKSWLPSGLLHLEPSDYLARQLAKILSLKASTLPPSQALSVFYSSADPRPFMHQLKKWVPGLASIPVIKSLPSCSGSFEICTHAVPTLRASVPDPSDGQG